MELSGFSLYSVAGPILLILAVLSLVSIVIIVAKLIELSGVTSGAVLRILAIDAWKAGDGDAALEMLSAGRAPADLITREAIQKLRSGAQRSEIEAHATRLGNAEIDRMHRNIRLLEVIALVSPLLGLLGTVLGMIESFQQLQLAGGSANASVLAGGIWQALLTTAAGLIVAIPALLAANLLSAKIDRASHLMEDGMARILEVQGPDAAS